LIAGATNRLAGVRRLYEAGLAEHGAAPAAVGWKDEAQQRLRFDKLAELLDPPPEAPVSVTDLGCGYGSLFDYLVERAVPLARYTGYDISPEMLEAARARVRDERARFLLGSRPAGDSDYSFVSGTFNVKLDASEDEWEALVVDTIRDLAEHSRRGLALNALTTAVEWRDPQLYYADADRLAGFCRTELGGEVTILRDYGLWEWTLLVRLEP
jgi:SAM-dependent methyltransferase